jgi:hypothetical protein
VAAVTGHVLLGCVLQLQQVGAESAAAGAAAQADLLLEQQRPEWSVHTATALNALEARLCATQLLLLPLPANAVMTQRSSSGTWLGCVEQLRETFTKWTATFCMKANDLRSAHTDGDATAVSALCPRILDLLQGLGELLCAVLPGASCCNNPVCRNLGTVSEAFALVRGKACVCGGCQVGGVAQAAGVDAGEQGSCGMLEGALAARCVSAGWGGAR